MVRKFITGLVFLVHHIKTIQNATTSDMTSCSSWFTNPNNESLQQNIISFENSTTNINNFILNTVSEYEATSMEDMIQVLANLRFKNYRMDECEDYLTTETIKKTSDFLQSFLENSIEKELVVLGNGITNNNNNNTTILASIIDQLSNQSHIQSIIYNTQPTLNASFINNIIYSITGGSIVPDDVTVFLVIVSDAEWKLLNRFLAELIDAGNLFWLRLTTTTHNSNNYKRLIVGTEEKLNTCTYEIPLLEILSDENDLVSGALKQKEACSLKHNRIIRAVTLFDQAFTTEVPSERSELGNIVCLSGSLPCRKPSNGTVHQGSWIVTCCAGYLVDIGQQLFDYLGYDWTLYITPDNEYGSINVTKCFENGDDQDVSKCKWSGLINEVMQDRADIALGALTPTTLRIQVVDFTESILVTKYVIAYRSAPKELEFVNWKYLKSLDWTLLVSLLVALVTVCIALFVVEHFMRKVKLTNKYPAREAFSYGAGLTFQRDLAGKTPDRWSARIIAISYASALTIIMTTYTANLTATNISVAEKDFKGLKDDRIKNPTPEFVYGMTKGTATELFFKSHNVYSQAYESFAKDYTAESDQMGLTMVSNGELDGFVAEYHSIAPALGMNRKFCESIEMFQEKFHIMNTLATQKGSELTTIISTALRDLRVTNGYKSSQEKWLDAPARACRGPELAAYAFTLEYAGGMVIMVSIVLLIALVVACAETIYTCVRSAHRFEINPS